MVSLDLQYTYFQFIRCLFDRSPGTIGTNINNSVNTHMLLLEADHLIQTLLLIN